MVRDLGGRELLVYTDTNNANAIRFYERNGFMRLPSFPDIQAMQPAADTNTTVLVISLPSPALS